MVVIPDPVVHPETFIASNATIRGHVEIQRRAVIMFGVVVRAEHDRIVIGEETNLQDNAVVHCDEGVPTLIGRRVTVGHGAIVHGATVGECCLIGIGALVLNRSRMGEGAWLAAGSVLPEGREVPPWTLAVGTPAKPLRELREDEVRRQSSGVDTYLELAAAYRATAG